MVNKPLDMKYIYKRERYLERKKALNENAEMLDLSAVKSPELYKIRVENYARDCASYKYALNLLETLYSDNRFDLLESTTQRMINDIIPMVESAELPECIDNIKSSNIGDINKDRLLETARMYKSIDRIRKNHRNLTKRFDFDNLYNRHKSCNEKCNLICEMVDTYNLDTFIKFNIALEELVYLGYSDGDSLNESEMVKNVTNYFLLRENNSKEDIASYKRAIVESKVIHEGSDSEVKYLMNGTKPSEYWVDKINGWKVNPEKKIDTLIELAKDNSGDLIALKQIVNTIDEFVKINELEFNVSSIIEGLDINSGSQAHNLMDIIKENGVEDSEDLMRNLRNIWEAEINDEVYSDGTTDPQTFSSDEIDKFKMHNLIIDAKNTGEFLDQLEKTSMKETPVNIKKILGASDSNINESNMIDFIDSNGFIDLKLRSYLYEGDAEDVYNLLESSVKCINNMLYGRDSKAFYTLDENTFSICLRTKYDILMTEAVEANRGFTTCDKDMILRLNEYVRAAEEINNSPIYEIFNKLQDRSYAANVSVDEVALIYEILSPYIDKDDNLIENFIDLCREEANPRFDRMINACSLVETSEFDPLDDHKARLEFCAYDVMGIEPEALNEGIVSNAVNKVKNKLTGNKNNNQQQTANQNNQQSQNNQNQQQGQNSNSSGANISVDNKAAEKVENKKVDNNDKQDSKEKESKEKDNNKEANPKNIADNKNSDNTESGKADSDKAPAEKNEVMAQAPEAAEKGKKKPTSINDLKLAWQGVKGKLKHGSAKEKEMERDLDMEFNNLCKNIQSTFSTDHREEIITGQVNRSLSKIIKIGIALAGAGGATALKFGISPFIVPAIGAVALFAKSKHSSAKEKKMILDEIDIELQVLDREIQRAESSGSQKKYRQLLTLQKNLQRRRQEIYYGLTKKGIRVPMQATAGMRGRE